MHWRDWAPNHTGTIDLRTLDSIRRGMRLAYTLGPPPSYGRLRSIGWYLHRA